MRHNSIILLFAAAIIILSTNSGCAFLSEVVFGIVGNVIDQETLPDDGRGRDADGLTERDIRARAEEATYRSWERDRQNDKWEAARKRDSNMNQTHFYHEWQNHLSRSQLPPETSQQSP